MWKSQNTRVCRPVACLCCRTLLLLFSNAAQPRTAQLLGEALRRPSLGAEVDGHTRLGLAHPVGVGAPRCSREASQGTTGALAWRERVHTRRVSVATYQLHRPPARVWSKRLQARRCLCVLCWPVVAKASRKLPHAPGLKSSSASAHARRSVRDASAMFMATDGRRARSAEGSRSDLPGKTATSRVCERVARSVVLRPEWGVWPW